MPVYFDHNATTWLDAAVLDAMQSSLAGRYGNPSSLHRFGRVARDAIDRAREQVAALVNAHPGQVVFTSGGTEANNTAVKGLAARSRPGRILLSAIEHPSVLELEEPLKAGGWQVDFVPVTREGIVDLAALQCMLDEGGVRLVSVMAVNNETGVLQPYEAIAGQVRAAGAIYHCDAVQAAGKLSFSYPESGAHILSLSSHKIYGPKGVGALILDKALDIEPLLHGGGHERGLRAGTENMPAIVGFGAAAELAQQQLESRTQHCAGLRDQLEAGLSALPDIRIFGQEQPRLPNTSQFSVPGYDGEALLMALDREGIAVSSGSACSSGKGEPSHVLLAMGIDEQVARGAIRVSLGKDNTGAEVEQFLSILARLTGAQTQQSSGDRFASVMGQ